jgi:hypothetical protein
MWERVDDRLALLELHLTGTLKRRQSQIAAWDFLVAAQWVRVTGKRDEIALREGGDQALVALLDRLWPGWQKEAAGLAQRGFPPTPRGWVSYCNAGRFDHLPELPPRINRHTLAALTDSHAKIAKAYLARSGVASEPMRDNILRLRVPNEVILEVGSRRLELSPIMETLGEIALPERAVIDGLSFTGPLDAALLIENLGLFCDLPVIEGWMYILVPGWDTPLASLFLESIGSLEVFHTPDLDPEGIKIHQHLRQLAPRIKWFCPSFAAEYIDPEKRLGQGKRAWPSEDELRDVPPVVLDLAAKGLWIEQEVFALDPRMRDYMQHLLE